MTNKNYKKKNRISASNEIRATTTKECRDINAGYVTWLALRTNASDVYCMLIEHCTRALHGPGLKI